MDQRRRRSKVRSFQIQRQNVRESGLWSLLELKLCGLLLGGYPTIAKSLKGMFEPQRDIFETAVQPTHRVGVISPSHLHLFSTVCAVSTLGFPNGVCCFPRHKSRERPDVSLFLPDCNQGEGIADVCFWGLPACSSTVFHS